MIASLAVTASHEVTGANAGANNLYCWLFSPLGQLPAFGAYAAVAGLGVLTLNISPAVVECRVLHNCLLRLVGLQGRIPREGRVAPHWHPVPAFC
jgi:hypothetical protein